MLALIALLAGKRAAQAMTVVSDELQVVQHVRDGVLNVTARFELPDTPFAYGFSGNITGADYFALEPNNGTYHLTACELKNGTTPHCHPSPRWTLARAALEGEDLVVTVTRDLAKFPVKDFNPAKNTMIFHYNMPEAVDEEEGEEAGEEEEGGEEVNGTLEVQTAPVPKRRI